MQTITAVALMDHDCKSGAESGCSTCHRLYLERSRQNWSKFLDKLNIIHKATQKKQELSVVSEQRSTHA